MEIRSRADEVLDLVARLRTVLDEQAPLVHQRAEMMDRKRRDGVPSDQAEFNALTGRIRANEETIAGLRAALRALATIDGSDR